MFPFKKSNKANVLPISQDDEKDSASEQSSMMGHEYMPNRHEQRSRSCRFWSSNIPWIITTAILAVYILAVVPPNLNTVKRVVGVEDDDSGRGYVVPPPWSPTDVSYTRSLLQEQVLTFTTGLDYQNENHTLQHTVSEGLKYVGPPGKEIDEAWEAIAGVQETFMTREEAIENMMEDTYISPLTKLHVVEIESFHHLHCLNYIRKSLDLDAYPDIANQQTWRIHVEHCINSIREFIMCKADFTPIRLVPPEEAGVPVPVPEFRTKHVCRNFNTVKEWVHRERNANLGEDESLAIAERIREQTGTRY